MDDDKQYRQRLAAQSQLKQLATRESFNTQQARIHNLELARAKLKLEREKDKYAQQLADDGIYLSDNNDEEEEEEEERIRRRRRQQEREKRSISRKRKREDYEEELMPPRHKSFTYDMMGYLSTTIRPVLAVGAIFFLRSFVRNMGSSNDNNQSNLSPEYYTIPHSNFGGNSGFI